MLLGDDACLKVAEVCFFVLIFCGFFLLLNLTQLGAFVYKKKLAGSFLRKRKDFLFLAVLKFWVIMNKSFLGISFKKYKNEKQ